MPDISEVTLFLLLIALSSLFAFWAAVYFFTKRSVPGALFLSLSEISALFWNIGYFIEIAAETLSFKMTGVKIQYFLGIPFTGVFWFLAVLDYTNFRRKSFYPVAVLLCIIPFLTMIFALTMESHELLYRNTRLIESGSFLLITKDWGPWFYVHVYYSYLILFTSAVYLIYFVKNQSVMFRGQAGLLLGGFLVPVIVSVIYVAGMNSFMRLDFTNIAFTYSAVVMGFAVQKYRLFDIVPAARDRVFESLEAGIIVADASRRVVDCNNSALQVFPLASRTGTPVEQLLNETEINADELLNGKIFQTEKHGNIYQIASARLSEGMKQSGYILTLHDVTRLKETEQKLNELNQSKDRLFSIIAHDLKNPFFGLIGLSEILMQDYDTTDDEYKKMLISEINLLSVNTHQLLDNLLDWSRQQTNQISFHPELFSIRDSLITALHSLNQIAKSKGIVIRNNVSHTVLVTADKYMIETVLRNLLSNAVKFSREGSVITVDLTELPGKTCSISISDQGVGMNKAALEKIFSPAEKPKTAGTKGERGSGLGLILCKDFIEKNGGTIRAESELGKGSTFTITLPVT